VPSGQVIGYVLASRRRQTHPILNVDLGPLERGEYRSGVGVTGFVVVRYDDALHPEFRQLHGV
jgi:hypothetical protein